MPSVTRLSRRRLLKSVATAIALPPLEAMFNLNGTLYAADVKRGVAAAKPQTRFLLWFNGNGITERYWMPTTTGADYEITPCLAPLAPFRDDIHIITGLDNPAARLPGPRTRDFAPFRTFSQRFWGGASAVEGRRGEVLGRGAARFRFVIPVFVQDGDAGGSYRHRRWARRSFRNSRCAAGSSSFSWVLFIGSRFSSNSSPASRQSAR